MNGSKRSRPGLIVIVLILAACLGACVSRPTTPDGTAIPSSVIADEAMVMENKRTKSKTWWAYQRCDGYEWYATRFVRVTAGEECEEWSIKGLSTTDDETKAWSLGSGFAVKDEVFYGSRGELSLRKGGAPMVFGLSLNVGEIGP